MTTTRRPVVINYFPCVVRIVSHTVHPGAYINSNQTRGGINADVNDDDTPCGVVSIGGGQQQQQLPPQQQR